MSETIASPEGASPSGSPPDEWVPVDRRVLGLDRRSLAPGLVVIAIWFIWAQALPWVNDQIDYDRVTRAGDVINLGAGELTMTPAPGWGLQDGVLMTDENINGVALGGGRATLVNDGLVLTAKTGPFDGTPDELLDEVIRVNDTLDEILAEDIGDWVEFTAADGTPGVLAPYRSPEYAGFIAAYVIEREDAGAIGIQIDLVVDESQNPDEALATEVVEMLATIAYVPSLEVEGS